MWRSGVNVVRPSSMMYLLFNERVCNDVVNSYLDLLTTDRFRAENRVISTPSIYVSSHTTVSCDTLFVQYILICAIHINCGLC